MPERICRPSAIVLCHVQTGLATVRGIGRGGIDVHAAIFDPYEPVRYSRYCRNSHISGSLIQQDKLVDWLIDYAKKLGNSPVVIPTSDEEALVLSKYFDELSPHCRIWKTDYQDLLRLISKGDLYNLAESIGVNVIPSITEPSIGQLEEWAHVNPGPYFLKPDFEGVPGSSLRQKNLQLPDRDALLDFAAKEGTNALVIQRRIEGGDGHIFDCYGLCGADGQPLVMASHRRLRQMPPDIGTTTYGEIPAKFGDQSESILFESTKALLAAANFHGIFGIEWLHDKETNKFYLIDFNARPFSSIGHLTACGLNLPLLAYEELVGDELAGSYLVPQLKHKLWVDLLRDLESLKMYRACNKLGLAEWLGSILRCRSFAYLEWRDPVPGIYRILQIVNRLIKKIGKLFIPGKG